MLFFHQRAALLDALRGQQLRAAENHRRARLNLVEEELAEVLHIHAALARVHNGCAAGHNEVAVAFLRALDGGEDFAQLAHAGRLNQQAVRMILRNQVIDRLLEVAHQRAADAAGIQLINDDARILHKAAVHADFAIFIFQQDDFFLRNAARQQLLDERRFARAQKTRNNVDLNHSCFSPIPQGLAAHSRHTLLYHIRQGLTRGKFAKNAKSSAVPNAPAGASSFCNNKNQETWECAAKGSRGRPQSPLVAPVGAIPFATNGTKQQKKKRMPLIH